jgi:hypothetical protein
LPPDAITALVRKEEQKVLLSALGINVVVGNLEDIELLSSLVKANDVVMNFSVPFGGGDASIQAIVDGLEARAAEKPHFKPVLLQTSGSGSVLHGSGGEPQTEDWTVSLIARKDRSSRAFPDGIFDITGRKLCSLGRLAEYRILSQR